MKVSEIRDLSNSELEIKLSELKNELFNLRFQNATNQLENPKKITETKKVIAMVMTVIRERELSEAAN